MPEKNAVLAVRGAKDDAEKKLRFDINKQRKEQGLPELPLKNPPRNRKTKGDDSETSTPSRKAPINNKRASSETTTSNPKPPKKAKTSGSHGLIQVADSIEQLISVPHEVAEARTSHQD